MKYMRALGLLVLAIPLVAACGTKRADTTGAGLAVVPHVRAYVSISEVSAIATVPIGSRTIPASGYHADTSQGLAVTPNGRKLYAAETGQFDVLAIDTTTGAKTKIPVGPFPQDVAVSRDGTKVYATVTGGDTGPGGSTSVAVISTATDAVTNTINVGSTPHRLVIAHHAQRGYVTDANGVALIDTVHNTVIGAIGDPGVRDIAVTPNDRDLYLTNPQSGTVDVVDLTHRPLRISKRIPLTSQPWAIAIAPNGKSVYVTRVNADAVAVIAATTSKVTRSIRVGRLPEAIAVTPDGTQAWVGDDMGSTITVINARNATTSTITGDRAIKTVAGVPLAIAFTNSSIPQ